MKNRTVSDILQLASRWEPFLLELPSDFGDRKAGTRWSVREVLGHLVDSTHFHRTLWLEMVDGDLERPLYDQNAWVEISGWKHYPWQDLVRLWGSTLRVMASVVDGLPDAALKHVWIDRDRTLAQNLTHFVEHQKHHLSVIEAAL